MSAAVQHTALFSAKFLCPVCRRMQFNAEPVDGCGYYSCQKMECRAHWWSAIIRQGGEVVYLSVVIQAHERHQFRGKPVTEMLRALRLMDDVQESARA